MSLVLRGGCFGALKLARFDDDDVAKARDFHLIKIHSSEKLPAGIALPPTMA